MYSVKFTVSQDWVLILSTSSLTGSDDDDDGEDDDDDGKAALPLRSH